MPGTVVPCHFSPAFAGCWTDETLPTVTCHLMLTVVCSTWLCLYLFSALTPFSKRMIIFTYLIDRPSAKTGDWGQKIWGNVLDVFWNPKVLLPEHYLREMYLYRSISVSQAFTCTLKAWEMDAWERLWISAVEYPSSPQQPLPSVGHMLAHRDLVVPYFQTLLVPFVTDRNKSSIQSIF